MYYKCDAAKFLTINRIFILQHFSDCTRVLVAPSITNIVNATAISGKCTQGACPNKEIFGVVVALGVLFVFLTAQPALQVRLYHYEFLPSNITARNSLTAKVLTTNLYVVCRYYR